LYFIDSDWAIGFSNSAYLSRLLISAFTMQITKITRT